MIGIIVLLNRDFGATLNWSALIKTLPWSFWIALALFIWAVGFAWSVAKRIYIEPPELLELTRIRTDGIELRTEVEKLKNDEDVKGFIVEYHEWERRMLSALEKLSSPSAEELAHIRDYPLLVIDHDVNYDHVNHRSILSYKLNKLDNFIDSVRGPLSNG